MGLFNRLLFNGVCRECGYKGELFADFKFGKVELDDYRLGDTLAWEGGRNITYVERPETGYFADYGFAVCPGCKEGWWVWITTERDVLTSIEPSNGPHFEESD